MSKGEECAYVMIDAREGRGQFVVVRELDANNGLALIPVEHLDDELELSIYEPAVQVRRSTQEAARLMNYISEVPEWRDIAERVHLVTTDESNPQF